MTNKSARAFTLVEMLVVLAIVALLLTLVLPRYYASVDLSREKVLKHNLKETREIIDKFRADTGRFPESLQELVDRNYLRTLPSDPITDGTGGWIIVAPQRGEKGAVFDLHSGAEGMASDGRPYREW